MHFRILILCLSACFLLGCRDGKGSGNPSLTNDELLQLMYGELFEVIVPNDIEQDQLAGLAIRYTDGKIVPMERSTGWTRGEAVKVVCFSPDKNTLRYAYFRKNGRSCGLITNFPITAQVSANTKRVGLTEGERLVRYSRDNVIAVTGEPTGDDFDVVFHVQDKRIGEQAAASDSDKPSN